MFQYPSSIILRERTHSDDVKDMKDAMSAVSVLYEQTLPNYVPCDEAWAMISIGNTPMIYLLTGAESICNKKIKLGVGPAFKCI